MKLHYKDVQNFQAQIVEIGFECFGKSASSFIEEYIKQEENDSGYTYFISKTGDKVVGYLLLSITEDEGEILQIAVSEKYRGRGFSTVLLNEAFSFCEQMSVKSLFLEVRESNTPALSAYKKNGFVFIGLRKDYYTDPTEDAVVMKRVFQEIH
jgi:[ribosomal protein S18]-alanine N-acetyltransferase